jgi:N-acetylglutamate synthase-like GNAT family acetyltransferase
MQQITLRPANPDDRSRIHNLVLTAHINPTGLKWQRFILAIDSKGQIIGCGQVKPHRDGSHELASIAVKPGWRNQGVARAIITYLLAKNPGELYLTCRAGLSSFYQKFNFRIAQPEELPLYFRRLIMITKTLRQLRIMPEDLLVMYRPGTHPEQESVSG